MRFDTVKYSKNELFFTFGQRTQRGQSPVEHTGEFPYVRPSIRPSCGAMIGDPYLDPEDPNLDPGDPNLDPGDPNIDPGDLNLDPGDPDLDPGDPDLDQL